VCALAQRLAGRHPDVDLDQALPHLAGGQFEPEGQRLVGEERVRGRQVRLPAEIAAAVAEGHHAVPLVPVRGPALAEPVLDLEEVGEVGVEEQRQLHPDRLDAVVLHLDHLAHATGHLAPPDHRERGVLVDRAGRLDQEERRLVVLDRLGGEDVRLAAVEP
jgi:hypothetical protein